MGKFGACMMKRAIARTAGGPIRTPKGYVPVIVGTGKESKRFVIQTSSLRDADLWELLCRSAEEYGFRNPGILKIPCDTKSFEELMLMKDGHRTSMRVVNS